MEMLSFIISENKKDKIVLKKFLDLDEDYFGTCIYVVYLNMINNKDYSEILEKESNKDYLEEKFSKNEFDILKEIIKKIYNIKDTNIKDEQFREFGKNSFNETKEMMKKYYGTIKYSS